MTEDPTCDKNRYVILSEKVQTPGKDLRPCFFFTWFFLLTICLDGNSMFFMETLQ